MRSEPTGTLAQASVGWHYRRRRFSRALIAAIAAVLPFSQAAAFDLGVSFSFSEVDTSRIADCARGNRDATLPRGPFLPRYGTAEVRKQVQQMLANMPQSGFNAIRTLVFFALPTGARSRIFNLTRDADRAAKNVAAYADDVAAAGFSTLFLVYAPEGVAAPYCKQLTWGDCFDPATLPGSVAFVANIRRALASASAKIHLFSDIAPDQCVTTTVPVALRRNFVAYRSTMLKEYLRWFPADETGLSCPVQQFAEGRGSIDEVYRQAGGRPSAYLLTVYGRPGPDSLGALRQASTSPRPVIVSETNYGDADLFEATTTALSQTPGGLAAVYFWPLTTRHHGCAIDVAPPYSLRQAEGR